MSLVNSNCIYSNELANKIIDIRKMNNEEKNKMKKKARETAIKYDSKNTKKIIIDVFKE